MMDPDKVWVNVYLDELDYVNMRRACEAMGISVRTAFQLFAKEVGRQKRIPFAISLNQDTPVGKHVSVSRP